MAEYKGNHRFKEGEYVFVLSSGLIYKAKVLQVMDDSYEVHYSGWNKTWDEIVLKKDVMPINEETQRLKTDLREKQAKQKRSRLSTEKKKPERKKNSMGEPKRGRKRKNLEIKNESINSSYENLNGSLLSTSINGQKAEKINKSTENDKTAAEHNLKKKEEKKPEINNDIKHDIPEEKDEEKQIESQNQSCSENVAEEDASLFYQEALSKWKERKKQAESGRTSDDQSIKAKAMRLYPIYISDELFEYISTTYREIKKDHKVFDFPFSYSITDIFRDYLAELEQQTANERLLNGLRKQASICQCLFNIILGKELLMVVERPQYARLLKENPGIPLVEIFGAPHLIRLFFYINRTFSLVGEVNAQTDGFYLLLTDVGNFLVRNYQKYIESNKLIDVSPDEMSVFSISLQSDSDEE